MYLMNLMRSLFMFKAYKTEKDSDINVKSFY